jgi:hypothetical protein
MCKTAYVSNMFKSIIATILTLFILLLSPAMIANARNTSCRTHSPEIVSTEWTTITNGLERRVDAPYGTDALLRVTVLRIDPSQLSMVVHYLPNAPASAGEWYLRLPESVAFVNGGFFNTNGNAQGLLVSYGRVSGVSLTDYGGTFVVTDSRAEVVATQDFNPNTPGLQHVVQGYPLLIEDGSRTDTDLNPIVARRTVVGQDGDGQIILAVTSSGEATLDEMAAYLCTSDFGLETAFNLDGGASSMLYTASVGMEPPYLVRSSSQVPAVIAFYEG